MAKSQQKGANGRIAEYYCAYRVAEKLKHQGYDVISDLAVLRQHTVDVVQQYQAQLTPDQIQLAIDSGWAIADEIIDSISNNGQNLVFVDNFVSKDYSYDIVPTGAQQNKGTSDDIAVHIHKGGQLFHSMLLSLKVTADSQTSQGSNGALKTLHVLFADPTFAGKTMTRASKLRFVEYFGTVGQTFLDTIEHYKTVGRTQWWNSPEGHEYRQAKIALGSKLSDYGPQKKTPGVNQLRSQDFGDWYAARHNGPIEHKLSQLFAELWNTGMARVQDPQQFNRAFKNVIGFDDVITLKAIHSPCGITVTCSSTNSKYQTLLRALDRTVRVQLTARDASGGIDVDLISESGPVPGLSLSIWKDGTIQFKFG